MTYVIGRRRYASQVYPKPFHASAIASALAFPNPQALEAFDASSVPDFAVASVGVVNDDYMLIRAPSAALLAAADEVNVILAAAPAGAIWARQYAQNLPAQFATAWFLDAAVGDDRNDGLSAGSALRTMRELSNRLRGATVPAGVAVTVVLAAGDYSAHPMQFDVTLNQGSTIQFIGAVTSTVDTIATILPTVPGAATTNVGAQRGTLTATARDVSVGDDRARLRITSGATAGAIAWVTRVPTPGVGGVYNVTRWGSLANPLTSTLVTNQTPAPGDSYALDVLTSRVGYLDLRVRGPGRIVLQDLFDRPAETTTVTHRATCDNGNANGVMAYGCRFEATATQLFQAGIWTMAVCSVSSDVGNIVYSGVKVVHRMCVHTGTANVPHTSVFIQDETVLVAVSGHTFDNAQVIIQNGSIWDQIGSNANDVQWCDLTGLRAVEVAQTGQFWAHSSTNRIWGLDNSVSSSTFLVTGRFFYNETPSVPGGASDANVGGTIVAYAGLPVFKLTAPGMSAVMTR